MNLDIYFDQFAKLKKTLDMNEFAMTFKSELMGEGSAHGVKDS